MELIEQLEYALINADEANNMWLDMETLTIISRILVWAEMTAHNIKEQEILNDFSDLRARL